MANKKKRVCDDTSHIKRKRHKKSYADKEQTLETEDSFIETAELLDAEMVREGMLFLGCVSEIKPTFLEMSLPGFLSGRVPLNNISNSFTKSLKDFATNVEIQEPSLSFAKVGMLFPCKVIEISRDSSKKKMSIILSINPADVNADLKPSLLYQKMVLFVSVFSIEDHGCVVDVGTKHITGFLPKQYYQDHREDFKIGEVIPSFVKQVSSDKTSAKIQLSPLDYKETFPSVSVQDVKLGSILPGAIIDGNVIDIKHPFIYIKYQCFIACANVLFLGSLYRTIQIGKKVSGTVLCVHPITHMIYLSLNLKPSPEYLELRKYSDVRNLKYFCSYKKFVYYIIRENLIGFFHFKDIPKSGSNENISKACVLHCHYMDNLVQLSANPSLLEQNIIFLEDVHVGDTYEAVVSKHVHEGMFVKICPGLSGFVHRIHMSDVFVTKPDILFPVGAKVKCRVLSTDGKSKLNLTSKESLIKLEDKYFLSSYGNVQKGQFYKGVIAQKTYDYILVLFFNDIKGIVLPSYVPKGIYFEGQTVLCEVLYCNSLRKKMRLSLQTKERCSVQDIDNFWNESAEVCMDSDILISKRANNVNMLSSDHSLTSVMDEIKSGSSTVKALIRSIKGNQINIRVNKTKGRIHITELECASEDTYPLKNFSVGQEIQVYVIGDFMKKKNNFLQISHKNYISFKECSTRFPPYTTLLDLDPGKSIMGFVKEVHDVSVVLWLTPYQIGVLEFLHYSENLKTIKKLHRHLKVGLSIKVSILENSESVVTLSKIEKTLPQTGRNIIGLVQVSCSKRGLVLKLPFGYHGSVAVTDITDIYTQVQTLFQKYCKFKFILCHVLEVNHESKYCQLSLRKSRIHGKTITSSAHFCPEITEGNIKVGDIMKGFVKSVTNSLIVITLGRSIEGKIKVHSCSSSDCRLCEISKSIYDKYPVGSIVEVIVKEWFKDRRSCILDMTACEAVKNNKCNRLDVVEDISWDE